MIYCVWYPSGGFGHFINGILTLYGKDFKRPNNKITFSSTGDSHSLDCVAPKYTKNYNYKFEPNYNYSVLVDLGINSNDCDFMQQFPGSQTIKLCYTDNTWPVVARTMIVKAMKSTLESEILLDSLSWCSNKNWAQREKYFLFLRDHDLRNRWKPESGISCITIDSMIDYHTLKNSLEQAGPELSEFKPLWNEWYASNEKYFMPVLLSQKIVNALHGDENLDLTDITDIWTQAVIYYFIWLEFGKEVPHNEFSDFFTDVNQIRTWLHR
jgi:hypothetical protein